MVTVSQPGSGVDGPHESLEARRLAEILGRLRGDAFLQGLAELLTSGAFEADISLGLLIDGRVLRGRVVPDEAAADRIDATLAAWLSQARLEVVAAPAAEDADSQVMRQVLSDALDGRFAAQQRSRRAYQNEVGRRLAQEWGPAGDEGFENRPRVEALPDQLVADVVDYLAPIAVVTLDDTEMLIDGRWTPIGMVRVLVPHVGAWWLESSEPGQ